MNEPVPARKSPGPSHLMGHVVRRGIPLLVLLFVLGVAYYVWHYDQAAAAPEGEQAPRQPIPVQVIVVQPKAMGVLPRHLGQTEGSRVVEIRARVAGHILERTFTEGDLVPKGSKLFQIDPRPFEVELAQARAQLQRTEAMLQRADQELQRLERLVAQNAATPDAFEQAQANQRVAAADVEVQKARIAGIELQLEYASVECPITGMVGMAVKDVGSYIDAGPAGLLTTVHQVDPIYVRFFVTEREILRFRKEVAEGRLVAPPREETEVELTLADGSTYPHRGHINYLDVQVDQQTGTAVVRGSIPNPDGFLLPGQFVHATVLGIQRVDVLTVPRSAVVHSPMGASVYVVNEQQLAEARPVTLGEWSAGEEWIIESGLNPGERVIVDRLMAIRPGAPVTVTAAKDRSQDADPSAPHSPTPAAQSSSPSAP